MNRSRCFRTCVQWLVVCLSFYAVAQQYSEVAYAQQQALNQGVAPPELTIKVLKGENGVNIIKKNTAVKPVVEVRDRNNLPVAGATVIFSSPQSGASAIFAHSSRTLTVLTNSAGRAAVSSM